MCSCEWNFTCERCAALWPIDADAIRREWLDWREQELERRNAELSRVDFQQPYGEAA